MTVKIGMIGSGGIARHHLNMLQKISLAEVVSLYDINRESAESMAAIVGAQVMNSVDELLNPQTIDAVFICAPQFAREGLEETAAARGIHIFVEKPLGLELQSVERKEQAIRDAGVIHSVGYCLRYYDTVLQAREYLKDKTIHLIQAHRFGGAHPAFWWRQQHMSGGNLADAVTHQVDMIRFIAGEYSSVSAVFSHNSIRDVYPDATIPDGGAVTFTLQSGAVGTITESCLSPYHSESEIKIFGKDFFIALSGNGQTLTIADKDQKISITSRLDPAYEQDKAFVTAVAEKSSANILCAYEDGKRTLAFTLAAYKSAEERSPIQIELGE